MRNASTAFSAGFVSRAAKGFETLSARDAQTSFLRAIGGKDLAVRGDFREVMWFQGLTSFLQPPKLLAPWDRSTFSGSLRDERVIRSGTNTTSGDGR